MRHNIPGSAQVTCSSGEPRGCYAHWRQQLRSTEALLLVDFEFTAYWLENSPTQPLTAIYYANGDNLQLAVTDQSLEAEALEPREQFLRWAAQHRLVRFDPAKPLQLEPRCIAKPWGREIWYTGVERRGVCDFACGDARSPIPWLQAVTPDDAVGAPDKPLVLLKILDPLPHRQLGDLYFELHESKREVYVVTRVDRRAWPDGTGYIRYGFDPVLLGSYADDDLFRADYLAAVQAYETQRRALDALAELGIAPGSAQVTGEQRLRQEMNRFTHLHPLREGDVVQVPILLPHALQHGVRTIELQTPSYERKILSFGQKVVTQDRWDTIEAVAQMELRPAGPESPAPRVSGGVTVEQIADFADFEALRLGIEPGSSWQVECAESYCLLIIVTGTLELAGAHYAPEQALLLPRTWRGPLAAPKAAPPLVFLLARPRS